MAPKKKGVKATAVVSAVPLIDVAQTAGLLVNEHMPPAKKRRPLKYRPTDEATKQSIQDNFKGWDTIDIDGRKCGNPSMTLRERLNHDKHIQNLCTKGERDMSQWISMGSNYYKELKRIYSPTGSSHDMLLVANEDEEINTVVLAAV